MVGSTVVLATPFRRGAAVAVVAVVEPGRRPGLQGLRLRAPEARQRREPGLLELLAGVEASQARVAGVMVAPT